ncbi:hypothetical protein N6H14_16255 [Paenibacillus sp. CC-CFT747]|nr:hypothetical protein N6H14_16255 [Paenibacillus sp. CC-CFT747]
MEHLLCVAEEAFDLVIAEVNAYWDNAATVCAMEQASERFVVTTPDITHFQEDFQRWMRTSCSLLGIPLSACRLIVNGGDPGGGGGIRSKDIAKDMGVELVAELTRYPDVTRFINQGTLTEWAAGQPLLRRQLDSVADYLMKMSGLAPAPAKARKTMKERMFPRISV